MVSLKDIVFDRNHVVGWGIVSANLSIYDSSDLSEKYVSGLFCIALIFDKCYRSYKLRRQLTNIIVIFNNRQCFDHSWKLWKERIGENDYVALNSYRWSKLYL